jgi:hypothetical protein
MVGGIGFLDYDRAILNFLVCTYGFDIALRLAAHSRKPEKDNKIFYQFAQKLARVRNRSRT